MNDKTKKAAEQQLARLQRNERKALAPKRETLLGQKAAAAGRLLEEKIPDTALELLRAAFAKGFLVVFENGTGVIERFSGAEKHRGAFEVNRFALDREAGKKALRRFDNRANNAALGNQALTVAEGGLLGIFGIGLPDIPVFLGMLLKNVYEVALSYGFGYESPAERAYVLAVICTALADGDEKQSLSAACDRIGYETDAASGEPVDLQAWTERASRILADRMVLAKSVQGIPLIGAVGGIANGVLLGQIGRMAKLKYKKRFLYQIKRD